MTNQEAIEIINRENNPNDKEVWDTFPEYREALDMAIKALTALDKIREEIEAIIGEHNFDDYDFCSGLICARNIIDKYTKGVEE